MDPVLSGMSLSNIRFHNSTLSGHDSKTVSDYHKRNNILLQAFLEQNQPAHTPIAILEWVDSTGNRLNYIRYSKYISTVYRKYKNKITKRTGVHKQWKSGSYFDSSTYSGLGSHPPKIFLNIQCRIISAMDSFTDNACTGTVTDRSEHFPTIPCSEFFYDCCVWSTSHCI